MFLTPSFLNSLTGKTELLKTREPGKVSMYVCGVTVYDDCHLGHARSQIVFDTVNRMLLTLGYEVRYVRNITDIDDKIIKKANDSGKTIGEITSTYIDSFHSDMKRLGVLSPSVEPRATLYLDHMISLIQTLLEKGHAYTKGGSVYFRVKSYPAYGELSHQQISELRSGARVESDEEKEDPLDFALWKGIKEGEPYYEAPFGPGRPGWHIECSAMSLHELGESFDIHGGGLDLLFPHHENERAQSEAATGKTFVTTWIHNGFVTINDAKMAKSLGNSFRIGSFFETSPFKDPVTAEWLRIFFLSTHYRSPVDISEESLGHAKASLDSLHEFQIRLNKVADTRGVLPGPLFSGASGKFLKALANDMDTAVALRILHEAKTSLNPKLDSGGDPSEAELSGALRLLLTVREVFGILSVPSEDWVFGKGEKGSSTMVLSVAEAEAMIRKREEARAAKNFKLADEIRDRLKQAGYELMDNPGGLPRIRRI